MHIFFNGKKNKCVILSTRNLFILHEKEEKKGKFSIFFLNDKEYKNKIIYLFKRRRFDETVTHRNTVK
jgi:hypothetical protein